MMNKIAAIIIGLLLAGPVLKAQDSMYVHQFGAEIAKFAVENIDSVVFTSTSDLYDPENPEITVGGSNSTIQGFTNKAIQGAVDALPPKGGTVRLSAGTFQMKAPIRLKSNVELIGSGDSTLLTRIDGFRSRIMIDADYGECEARVVNPNGFSVGMSIQVSDRNNWICEDVTVAVITGIEGNTLHFDSELVRNYRVSDNGTITNAGSCISVVDAQNVLISNLKIDGNRANNDELDGCFGGGIAITRAQYVTVDSVRITNFNGEGITWQLTDHVSVINSEIWNCANMGLHPGIGSPNTLVENNNSHHNRVGLFLCWRVVDGMAKGNQLHHNSDCGISTGHKDTDMLFVENHIYENGKNGIEFRDESASNSPHRTTFLNNIVEDNGTINEGFGFKIQGNAEDILIKDNIIRNNANGKQKAPISLRSSSPAITLENNTISGHRLGDGIVYE